MFPGTDGTPPHGASQSESRPCSCIGLSLQLRLCTPLGADRVTTNNLVMHFNDYSTVTWKTSLTYLCEFMVELIAHSKPVQ